MYLDDFSGYRVENLEALGEFRLALVTNDFEGMVQWARLYLESIKVGTPKAYIPDDETIREWERKSLQFLKEVRTSTSSESSN